MSLSAFLGFKSCIFFLNQWSTCGVKEYLHGLDMLSPREYMGTDCITLAVNNIDWPIINIGSMVAQLKSNTKQLLGSNLTNSERCFPKWTIGL